MSKSLASASKLDHKILVPSDQGGGEDEGKDNNDGIIEIATTANSTISNTLPTAPPQVDDFVQTPDFKRLLISFVHDETLTRLSEGAFSECPELKSLTIPDSLQTLGFLVFCACFKLVPSNIDAQDNNKVVAYLSSQQKKSPTTATLKLTSMKLCGYPGCSEPAPLKCSHCKDVNNCSKNYQKAHWKVHKKLCVSPSKKMLVELEIVAKMKERYGKKGETVETTNNAPAANPMTSMTKNAAHATVYDFMATVDFKRLLIGFVPDDTLMALKCTTKAWKAVAESAIDAGVESGQLMVHGVENLSFGGANANARKERLKLATRVIFLLNITKVGEQACLGASNSIIVDIPESVESIGIYAFSGCQSLTTVSFLTTLTFIGYWAFGNCTTLENVDLLHTNLQELEEQAFDGCSELTSMTIPDSLQTLGNAVFWRCSKLVPSNIHPTDSIAVVAHLRSQQLLSATPPNASS
ncbi:hypothetical protein TL16_g06710 [Triparma laevis f. inornata]|uniref:MYND-type domain-containing protein n=1 Tax=Triparma laevis f. inornata TaxID=1714386 RepID=A0A9W7EE09_9STRA|nr:hypothetical protein TL16_g06710 [Triparma laevis f. inornata]